MKHYATIDEFYDDRGGRYSGECDFGVWHWDDCGIFSGGTTDEIDVERTRFAGQDLLMLRAARNSRIRVSVVDETGDVYAIRSGLGEDRVVLLGNLGVTNSWKSGRGDRRDIGPVYERAEQLFEGWAHAKGLGRGLSWFIERIPRD